MNSTDLHPFANPGRTKLSLVSRGVALPEGLAHASQWVAQANAVESVVDIRLPTGQFCSVPVGQPYTEESGFSLHVEDGKARLECGGETETVELVHTPKFYSHLTRGGARMGSFASLHDRLLILHPSMGCGFFAQPGQACGYCQYDSMLNEPTPPLRDSLELVEVVRAALAEREVDTVYLYNGFAPGADVGLKRLIPLIALLRKHLGHRQIALETVAPQDVTVIDELYSAGLDIFICNLEVADTQRFAEVCPGKHAEGGQEAILTALEYAQKIFRPGTVVSHLIVGLEPLAATVSGMKRLIDMGVVPLLLPFRPLPGTPLANETLPTLDDVEQALLEQYELLAEAQLPTHRLRDMGRVLTPMESGALLGRETMLHERVVSTSFGRKLHGWLDGFRRHLRVRLVEDGDTIRAEMDSRPMHMLLASRSAPFVALAVIATIFWGGLLQSGPDALGAEGWRALLVFLLCLTLWVTQLLPLAVTSILGMALLPLLGVLPATDVYAMFGNKAVFFILGAFILAAGIMKSGLSEHLALAVFNRFGDSPKRLLLAILMLPAIMACFMPEHAVVAVLLPIVWSIVRGLDLQRGNHYASALFLALAWGAVIGGALTLLGGARGPLALAIVEETTGKGFSFADYTLSAFPVVLLMLVVASLWLNRAASNVVIDMAGARERIAERQLELGQLSVSGRMMAALMLVTVSGWVLLGEVAGLAGISLLAVVAMFALRIVKWREIQSHVDWGVILMYGGAIAVAKALEKTGAANWLAGTLWPDGLAGPALLVLLALLTLLLTEAISNSAAVAIMLPLAIPLGSAAGVDPVMVALTVGIVSGFAFMLPMGTPANAMIYGTGYVRFGRMIGFGSALSLCALLLFALTINFWWPLVGVVE